MHQILSTMVGEKVRWKRMEARAGALPRGYRIVHAEMESCLWRFTAADGQRAPEVTGEDLAAYRDAGLSDRSVERWRASLDQGARARR